MLAPDGTILMHEGKPYNAAKAHEYYMRTRKLHPRKKGAGTFTVSTGGGHTAKLTSQELAEQRAYANHRVTLAKAKLSKLTAELHQKMAKAHASEAKSNKAPTAADKHKKAQESKKYRDAHQQSLKTKAHAKASAGKAAAKTAHPKTNTVAGLKKQIVTARSSLKAAVQRQRQLATAKKSG